MDNENINRLLIDTEDLNSTIESLALFFNVNFEVVKDYIEWNNDKMLDDVVVEDFIDYILDIKEIEGLEISSNFDVTCFHLTKRIEIIDKIEPLLNLQNLLIGDNEISNIFKRYNLYFKVDSENRINCIYNNEILEWDDYGNDDNYSIIAMIKSRLGNFNITDSCVNGVLFNEDMVNEGDIRHLRYAPEIVQHIFEVLPFLPNKVEDQFEYLYIVKYKLPFNDFIFDCNQDLHGEDKLMLLIKTMLIFCANKNIGFKYPHKIPFVRTNDFRRIDSKDIISYQLVTD